MFKTFIDFFKNKDIRKKIFFTLFILFIFRLGASIPAPGVNTTVIKLSANSLLTMMSILGGGSIEQMSILSLGVGPYITASIIIELLAMDIIPALAEMAKSGKKGRQQMDVITRYLAVVMALVQGYFIVQYLDNAYAAYGLIENPGFTSYLYIAIIFTAGTMFTLWLADQITTKGIGNGTSMIIFAGIVADMPTTFRVVYETFVGENATSPLGVWGFIAYCVMFVAIIVLVVLMQMAERRIPIQQSSSRA
ncbi:MAG: preprotein translocase subunit SecY, partial [Erysipelotrichaceae bacterium]|nr:preprotein translocase subunit SecY [Erysipelotrichaceae bacterium]